MGKGRTYELDMVRDVNSAVDQDTVFTATLDYSGVASDSDADLLVTWPEDRDVTRLALIELKKRSGSAGKRFPTHPLEGSTPDQNGMTELRRLVDTGPTWADRWFALKPDHRELVVFDAEWLLWHLTDTQEGRGAPYTNEPTERAMEAFQPRETPAGHVSMRKPELDEWESSTAGPADELKLLDAIGVPDHYMED